ncbi:MAG: hypothetical protein QXZ70_04390 [Candidatus Bathyarchaeia archaeon]
MVKKKTKSEIIEYYNRVFQNFLKDPAAAGKLEEYRRKYSQLTAEDLLKIFTI